MKRLLSLFLLSLSFLFAQSPQVSKVTPQDKYLRYILITLGTPGNDPILAQAQERAFVSLLSLSPEDLRTIQALALQYGNMITTFRANRQSVLSSKHILSTADRATLDGYVTKLDQDVGALTKALLSSVTPATAARIQDAAAAMSH